MNSTLYQWFKGLNLPTCNPSCLGVLTYTRWCSYPLHIQEWDSDEISPSGRLPFLLIGEEENMVVEEDIIRFLQSQGYNLDASLTKDQNTTSLFLKALLTEKLAKCLLYSWWYEDQNQPVLSKEFTKHLNAPFRHIQGFLLGRKNYLRLRAQGFNNAVYVQQEADKVFELLSAELSNKSYFFGEQPTSLDAIAYGHLACILYPDLPNRTLRQQLEKWPNLVAFCERIKQNTFDSPLPSVFLKERLAIDDSLAKEILFPREPRESDNDVEEYPPWVAPVLTGVVISFFVGWKIMKQYHK